MALGGCGDLGRHRIAAQGDGYRSPHRTWGGSLHRACDARCGSDPDGEWSRLDDDAGRSAGTGYQRAKPFRIDPSRHRCCPIRDNDHRRRCFDLKDRQQRPYRPLRLIGVLDVDVAVLSALRTSREFLPPEIVGAAVLAALAANAAGRDLSPRSERLSTGRC